MESLMHNQIKDIHFKSFWFDITKDVIKLFEIQF